MKTKKLKNKWPLWSCILDGCYKKAATEDTQKKREKKAARGKTKGPAQKPPSPGRVKRGRVYARVALIVWEREKGICFHCKKNLSPGEVTFDHVIPVSFGGRTRPDNLVLAHEICNRRRGNKLIENAEELNLGQE